MDNASIEDSIIALERSVRKLIDSQEKLKQEINSLKEAFDRLESSLN